MAKPNNMVWMCGSAMTIVIQGLIVMVVSILSRIYIVCDCALADPIGEGALGTRATVQFFQFHAVFGGNGKNNRLASAFGFDAPCLGNPGSTTDMGILKMINVEQTFIYEIGKYLEIFDALIIISSGTERKGLKKNVAKMGNKIKVTLCLVTNNTLVSFPVYAFLSKCRIIQYWRISTLTL